MVNLPMVKTEVSTRVVALLGHRQTSRGMELLEFRTRCVRRYEIHELVTTTDPTGGLANARAGDRIDRVGFLGFAEVTAGGVIERGDAVSWRGRVLGRVVGFDGCHHPNHYNILIHVDELSTGHDLGLGLGDALTFSGPAESHGS